MKWIEDRQEHFLATTQQRDQIWTVDVAFTAEGRMLGLRGRGVHDNGAYAPYGLILAANALGCFPGPYAFEALDVSLDVVLTNMVPTTPVRGASRPTIAFVLERMADRVAAHLGIPRDRRCGGGISCATTRCPTPRAARAHGAPSRRQRRLHRVRSTSRWR